MKWIQFCVTAASLAAFFGSPIVLADAETDELRGQFEDAIRGLNDNSFERFNRLIVKNDMTARVYSKHWVEPDVKRAFASDFSIMVEQMFGSSFPKTNKEILGTLVDFEFEGEEGRAVVRYAIPRYRYSYHIYKLKRDSKGRLNIVDWVDYYQGGLFSDEAGASLVMAMPSKQATRSMLTNKRLSDNEIFQTAELFKAVRDQKPERFFEIYDRMSEAVWEEPTVAKLYLHLSLQLRDNERIENAVRAVEGKFADKAVHSLRLVEYYIPTRQYDKVIDALVRLQGKIGVVDGATESLKAAAALAMGNIEDSEEFALNATVVEPSLELGWWSLLRARTRGEDYTGATEVLARLEDDFGHTLDPQKLKRDRFLKVLADKPEYLDWRASRE